MFTKKIFTGFALVLLSLVSYAQENIPLDEENIHLAKEARYSENQYLQVDHKILDHPVDIRKYTLQVTPSFATGTLTATTEIKMISQEKGLESFDLNFVGGWNFSDVSIDGETVSYDFDREVLKIYPNTPLKNGERFNLKVSYFGRPSSDPNNPPAPFQITGTWAYTFSQPFQARYWFPCFDEPSDKAEEGCDISVTVPNSLEVAANGHLVSVTQTSSDTRTHRWIHSFPISTYLLAISINDYVMLSDSYKNIPLKWYVYPNNVNAATYDFGRHGQMMQAFENAFGEYPFDNYGVVLVPGSGWGMEHQSMTTLTDNLVTGTRRYEMLIAHELAHQWWGDAVTCKDYREIWLNEGFASYAEAIWGEFYAGEAGRDAVMRSAERTVRGFDNLDRHALYIEDYDPNRMFSPTVYEKGSFVLHMLRFELGDEAFFNGLKEYLKKYKYSVADTTEFREVMEEVSGRDLEGFFQGWIYGVAWPQYEISSYIYEKKGSTRAVITVHQKQDHDTVFNQTILIDPDGDGPMEAQRKYVDGKWAQFEVTVTEDAAQAELVETSWLLMDISEADYSAPIAKKISSKKLEAGKTHEVTISGSNFTPATRLFLDSTAVKLKKVVIAEDGNSLVATIKIPKKAKNQVVGYRVINPDGDTYTKKKGFRIIAAK